MTGKLEGLMFLPDGRTGLTVSVNEDCRQLFDDLKNEDIDITIKKHRQKRSLDANAYAWVLMDKLAEKLGYKKEDIYRYAVRNVGGNTDTVCVKHEAVNRLIEQWQKNGLGWVADIAPSKIEGCTNVILYYGTSTFDSYQMSRFIDSLVQDCKDLGIETMPPEKLKGLLEEWT